MTPETKASPYDAAIADIESRIRKMQITLETLNQLRAGEGQAGSVASSFIRPGETEVQHDSFFGMTIGEASKKYLTMAKATKTTADIAAALERGGLKHSSKDFQATVRSTLGQAEEFIRVPNGELGLADWYPGMGRGKKGNAEKGKAEKPVKKAKRKSGRQAKSKKGGPRLEDRILSTMKGDANKDWGSTEIATKLGEKRESVQSTMSRMAKAGQKITKAEKGYRLVKLGIAAA